MAFRADKLTVKAQEAVADAQNRALALGNPDMDTLHLLESLLQQSDGVVVPLLKKLGVAVDQLRTLAANEIQRLPKVSGGREPQVNPSLRTALDAAAKTADDMKDEFVSTEHLFLGLLKSDGKAQSLLKLNGIQESDVLKALQAFRGSARVTDQNPEGKFNALEKYGIPN